MPKQLSNPEKKSLKRQAVHPWENGAPMGFLQALIVKVLRDGHVEGSGESIRKAVEAMLSRQVDVAQVYGALRTLESAALISVRTTRSNDRGPATKLYGVTPKGCDVLAQTTRHFVFMVKQLGG